MAPAGDAAAVPSEPAARAPSIKPDAPLSSRQMRTHGPQRAVACVTHAQACTASAARESEQRVCEGERPREEVTEWRGACAHR